MKIITSPMGTVSNIRPTQGLQDLNKAGFDSVLLDFNLFCSIETIWPSDKLIKKSNAFRPEVAQSGFDAFIKVSDDIGMDIDVAKVPSLEALTTRTGLNEQITRLTVDCVKACEANDVKYVIAEPLFAGINRGAELTVNTQYYISLAKNCQKEKTKILLKNQVRNIGGHLYRGNCCEPEEIKRWIDELNIHAERENLGTNRFGFCLDLGIANICGQDIHELIIQLDGYIDAVVIRDNDGKNDKSILPYAVNGDGGSTDYLGLIRGLRDTGFDRLLIFDYATTASAFPPMLKPAILEVAKQVADYFKWQIEMENAMKRYEHIVLFGAGNMCRNYMKNYGDKYPPLFTCDNNSTKWGEFFCELEIKSPECLKNLPEGTGVFICNIYYREIETQLRQLGVKSIEYFNDEYMPSFFMERLAMS